MDLKPLFPQHDVCLYSEAGRERTWRIANVPPTLLNFLTRWLKTELLTVAVNGIIAEVNTSPLYSEVLAHRLGLVPIAVDPLRMERFEGDSFTNCTDRTCVVFDLVAENNGRGVRDVMSGELQWVPFGNQLQIFADRPPMPYYSDLLLVRLYPGQAIKIRAYAVLGTGAEQAKWSAVNAVGSPFAAFPQMYPTCLSCEQLAVSVRFEPGFGCYYYTIELTGGLDFSDVQQQILTRFDWQGQYPPKPLRYFFEQK